MLSALSGKEGEVSLSRGEVWNETKANVTQRSVRSARCGRDARGDGPAGRRAAAVPLAQPAPQRRFLPVREIRCVRTSDIPSYVCRTFIYPFFTRGRPFPLQLLFFGTLFCVYNGFLQGYYLIYCAEYPNDWCTDIRFTSGLLLFLLGMGINIHSDLLLRQLRKPGEVTYKIPQGGLFTYVSGANYFGEIVEWFGFAIATWSLPAFTFAFFTLCCIGPRAYHHHRYYLKTFTDYPKSRKALIPFVF
ncbi:3-oxo-5-alpha-steroid 4-dehydrogenase 2 isoform X2 [Gallus gallus]|uniref:3-oxo-5-alpha-steroid 4-dehydrogenase 2 isoform X2 n=1 Tax=Gallus gallus TaxID=9031 RepID=UPI001EFF8D21|nr:3-oxo-5-alpha-steroid 4-dehydrogenase 2 isoform X2 [Gallus gallus]XP_046795338.1 3-oxo-5-alpha-steroid 4-dehydrogenase 2 isoform X2 [Gallus gallus]